MTPAHRVVIAIVTLQQYWLQRAHKSNDWGLSLMPSLARGLCFSMALGFTCIELGDLCISPHSIPQHQIVPTGFRPIPHMIK